jgi:hypothetical protein
LFPLHSAQRKSGVKKTTRETELERDALQEDLGMLAMGPRNRLPGERGFLVLVF